MFRVEAFVDDKRLAQLLHNMAGVITGEPKIQPVVNAKVENGKAVAASSGDLCDLFTAYAKKHKITTFGTAEGRAFCKSVGKSENSYGYVIRKLFECKLVKKTGKGAATRYTVVK